MRYCYAMQGGVNVKNVNLMSMLLVCTSVLALSGWLHVASIQNGITSLLFRP